MNWTAIYTRALRQTHTNPDDYDISDASEDMNLRYQELVDEIVNVTKWDYFWDIWESNTVVGQSEYLVEKLGIAPDDLDIKKINKVFIKYSADQEIGTLVKYQNPWVLSEHPDYYKTNQSKNEPFFYIQDTSIFIYPAPTEIVADGLEIFVIHKPEAITTASTEEEIELPYQYHKLISDGLRIDIFLWQAKENEAQVAQKKYDKGIGDMLSFIKSRYNQPIVKQVIVPNSMR